MNPYTELKYNFDGIKNILQEYTHEGILTNYVSKLEDALLNDDLDAVKYFLDKLSEWYEENLGVIVTNEFVNNKEDHRKTSRLIKEINPKIQLLESIKKTDKNPKNIMTSESNPVFFISHKSKDKDFGNIIRQLLLNIGVKNNQIIFTSNSMNKIPFGEDIFEYLRKKITQNTYVIYLISDDYFNSSACLNEMGAAWVMQTDNARLFLPDFNFRNTSYLDSCIYYPKMGVSLNGDLHCQQGLISMAEKIIELAHIDIATQELSSFVDLSCEDLKKIAK